MRKKKFNNGFYGVILFITIILAGCSATDNISGKGNGKTKHEIKKDVETLQNDNYLLTEAIKQKITGNYEMALKFFATYDKLSPGDDAVSYQLSQLWAMAGDVKRAKDYGWKAIQGDPRNIWYYYQLASIYQQNNALDTVVILYKKMIDQFPDKDNLKYALAKLYTHQGSYKEAVGIYNSLIKKYGYNENLGLALEEIYEKSGQTDKAEKECNKLLELYPNSINVLGIKAELYSKTGKNEEAEQLYKKLMDNYDDEAETQILMSYIEHKIRVKNKDEVEKNLKTLLKSENLDEEDKINYCGGLLENVKSQPEMEKAINKSVINWMITDSVSFQTKAQYADIVLKTNDSENSLKLLKNIVKERPEILAAWQQIGIIEQQTESLDSLIIDMSKAIELHEDDPLLYLLYGSGLMQKEENSKALNVLKKGLKFIPDNKSGNQLKVQYYGMIGDVNNALENYKESDNAYEKALNIDPENMIILNNYGYYLSLREERLGEALKMSKKTIDKEPENPTYLDTYGWILFKMGRTKEAEKYIRKALEENKDNSTEIIEHYGDILQKMGKIKEAITYWEKALLINPGNVKLKEKIEKTKNKVQE